MSFRRNVTKESSKKILDRSVSDGGGGVWGWSCTVEQLIVSEDIRVILKVLRKGVWTKKIYVRSWNKKGKMKFTIVEETRLGHYREIDSRTGYKRPIFQFLSV